jgi:hypothetical protein
VQICKCFRDEDLRADRQPEFTQVDVEMSFARPETIFGVIEPLMRDIFTVIGPRHPDPFPRMSYADAMAKYGSDKPDLRPGLEIQDLREQFRESKFRVFKEIVGKGGTVRGFVIPKASHYSRSEVDGIVGHGEAAARGDGPGVGAPHGRRSGHQLGDEGDGRGRGDAAAGGDLDRQGKPAVHRGRRADATSKLLGQLRLILAKKDGLLKPDEFKFTWVVDFPLLEWDPEEKRYNSMHHPFTSPLDDDMGKLENDPGNIRAKAYDLVLNGSEIGGGSIQHPRLGDAEPHLLAAQHQRGRGEAALRVLPRGARVRHAAARGHRARPRSHHRDPRERELDSRGHRLPEDGAAVDLMSSRRRRGHRATAGAAHPGEMKKIALSEEGIETSLRRARREPETHRIAAQRRDSDAGRRDHHRGRPEGRAAGAADLQAAQELIDEAIRSPTAT